jgi:hypothetical protein
MSKRKKLWTATQVGSWRDRDDYNEAMQKLFDALSKMIKDKSGELDEDYAQDINNAVEETISQALKDYTGKREAVKTDPRCSCEQYTSRGCSIHG